MNLNTYLSERVGKVVLDSDKIYNEGARLLANHPTWKEDLEQIINSSWDTLVKFCIRSRGNSYSASVKLTFASTTIGARICKAIQCEPTIKSQLALGDIMLETFLQDGLVNIYREFEGPKAPYMVRIMRMPNAIKPTLIGTFFEPLKPIRSLHSAYTGDPYIKGWNNNDEFLMYLGTTHIQALDKVRMTGWELNPAVLKAVKANKPAENLQLANRDGVVFLYPLNGEPVKVPRHLYHMDNTPFLGRQDPKLQRALSKYFEYDQILKKALIVESQGGKFWQEATCDYRGRVYYSESFLEYQGSDMARSLFLFQKEEVVTEAGLKWMYIHAANSYNASFTIEEIGNAKWTTTDYVAHLQSEGLDTISLDKMTLKDRERWTNENIFSILEWGQKNVLREEADKPYAFLAACVEIFNYKMAQLAKKPYKSKLPIPVDGSNNGWQHLAAISKDKQAGELVSLTPAKIQKDFYVAVAKDLIKIMPDWFEDKAIPMKHIRKGISKRGSMTRAYSAGKKRIAKNMYDDCHIEGFTVMYDIDEVDCDTLATNLITAINTVCAGPLKTTKFMQKLAEFQLNAGSKYLCWTSPSGFPVKYKAYLQREAKQRGTIKGICGSKDGRIMHVVKSDVIGHDGDKVACRRSFASGIAPNYIHSLDAAHMASTINSFAGSFAAVHDSFATHASFVDELQLKTKEEFVKQYDVDNYFKAIVENLIEEPEKLTVEAPKLGRLNIKEVMKSEYFFC